MYGAVQRSHLTSLSHSKRVKRSPSLTGPLKFVTGWKGYDHPRSWLSCVWFVPYRWCLYHQFFIFFSWLLCVLRVHVWTKNRRIKTRFGKSKLRNTLSERKRKSHQYFPWKWPLYPSELRVWLNLNYNSKTIPAIRLIKWTVMNDSYVLMIYCK